MQAARPLIQTRMDPSFLFFTPNSDHAMLMLKQKSKQIRPGNIFKVSYAVSNFGELMQIVASVSCS